MSLDKAQSRHSIGARHPTKSSLFRPPCLHQNLKLRSLEPLFMVRGTPTAQEYRLRVTEGGVSAGDEKIMRPVRDMAKLNLNRRTATLTTPGQRYHIRTATSSAKTLKRCFCQWRFNDTDVLHIELFFVLTTTKIFSATKWSFLVLQVLIKNCETKKPSVY